MADRPTDCAAGTRDPMGPFEALCARLFTAMRVDGSWSWEELNEGERGQIAGQVRAALDTHVAGLCAALLERAAKGIVTRPGRPHGDKLSEGVAEILSDVARDLRADATALAEVAPPLLSMPGEAALRPDVGRAMVDLIPLAKQYAALVGMGPFRIGLHLSDEGKFLAEVANEHVDHDIFGDWCAEPIDALSSLRRTLDEALVA